jgi:hypothetical protein
MVEELVRYFTMPGFLDVIMKVIASGLLVLLVAILFNWVITRYY